MTKGGLELVVLVVLAFCSTFSSSSCSWIWINASDIIPVGLQDYQDNKADVILKYNADEARNLKAYGELPEHAKINESDTFGPGEDDEVQFDDIDDDDDDEDLDDN
ncbi:eukaryotic translation initiation factor 1A, Y-chromosomal-like [Thomomys bottae]